VCSMTFLFRNTDYKECRNTNYRYSTTSLYYRIHPSTCIIAAVDCAKVEKTTVGNG
ncbi:hypothetical protein L9F63_009839, partial [Diploptera punctata]